MSRIQLITLLFLLIVLRPVYSQDDNWSAFQAQLEQLGVQLATPVENQYKEVKGLSSLYQCDHTIRKRKGDMEIRFSVIKADSNFIPHIKTMCLITLLATNEQETVVSVLSVDKDDLHQQYNADWGVQAYFQPKPSFSTKQHCKLLALYREGKAMTYLLYLFDEPNDELEQQKYVLRFDEESN